MNLPRIVSLSPALTDTVLGLNLGGQLRGVTHECYLPEELTGMRRVSLRRENRVLALAMGMPQGMPSPYVLDLAALRALQPDWVLTDDPAQAAALQQQLRTATDTELTVLGWPLRSVAECQQMIQDLGERLGAGDAATRILARMARDFTRVADRLRWKVDEHKAPVRVCIARDLQPLTTEGGVLAELLTLVQAEAAFAAPGSPEAYLSWERYLTQEPDQILLVPYGQNLTQLGEEMQALHRMPELRHTRAFRSKKVVLGDAQRYFRAGTELGTTLDLLLDLLHPEAYGSRYLGKGWSEFF